MKVSEVIKMLKLCNMDADVVHLWDGETRTSIEHVYMGKTGDCVTADNRQVAYSDSGRPIGAPDSKQAPYWRTPEKKSADTKRQERTKRH